MFYIVSDISNISPFIVSVVDLLHFVDNIATISQWRTLFIVASDWRTAPNRY
jgi:hypothetical protein